MHVSEDKFEDHFAIVTLIFRVLHRWQPAFDFLCDLLGGMARAGRPRIRIHDTPRIHMYIVIKRRIV